MLKTNNSIMCKSNLNNSIKACNIKILSVENSWKICINSYCWINNKSIKIIYKITFCINNIKNNI